MQNTLKNRAVLMRLSIGLPGENRQDPVVTEKTKQQQQLGSQSGKWVKMLYPPEALGSIKELDNMARAYHAKVTLPFDAGIGILPSALIMEYGDKMREFAGKRAHLIQSKFLDKYQEWVEWAKQQHNGTFDPAQYPGAAVIADKFYFRTEPLPVPDSTHFENTVSSLLGVDAQSVDNRVQDAAREAQQELMRRLIDPVRHIATTLAKEKPKIYETLLGNVGEIADLAPKLNLAGDPAIDKFCGEMQLLLNISTEQLRTSDKARKTTAQKAQDLLKKLEGYKL